MSIVWTILIGFVAGLIARALKPGDDSAGFIVTTLIGIAGSLVATYVGQFLGWYTAGQGGRLHRLGGRCHRAAVHLGLHQEQEQEQGLKRQAATALRPGA